MENNRPVPVSCRNCEAELNGPYCQTCGQKAVTTRLSISEVLREIPSKMFSMERGLWLTFVSLCLRPGQVCLDYVQGKRLPYLNPLSYFLLGASVQLVSLWFTAPLVRESVSSSIENARNNPASVNQIERMDEILGGEAGTRMGDIYLSAIAQGYTYLAFLTFTCPLAFGLWLGHRWYGSNYHLAETMVLALYLVAQCLILTAVTSPIATRIGSSAQMFTSLALYIGLLQWAHTGFYQKGLGP